MFNIKPRDKRLKLKKNNYIVQVDEEYILLSIHPFNYFYMNETMYMYWKLIQEYGSYDKVLDKLKENFNEPEPEQIRQDLDSIIESLKENQLLL